MTTEAATPEFYSACLQVILISWLIVAVETRVFTRTSMPTWIKIGLFAYGFTSVVAIYWCIRGLNKADVYIAPSWWPYGEITTDLIEGITTAMAFAAVFTMVATVLLPQFFNPGAQTTRIRYRGSVPLAHKLVQTLREQGVTIDAITRPTTEYRDQLRTAPENVIRTLVATGWAVTISTCVREFQQRFPEADVEIVDEFDEDKGEDD